jgi:hypothetical protein
VAAAIKLPEWRARRRREVFRAIAALALASATASHPSATLTSAVPWWERVTVTVTDDGQTHSCRYESSLQPNRGEDCAVQGSEVTATKTSGSKDQYTRITFERRFNPGAQPETALQAGEVLLGGRVMALAIDPKGAVKDCRVVSTSGAVTPQYGCSDLSAERFETSAGNAHARTASREGFMTILVYGHSEHVV